MTEPAPVSEPSGQQKNEPSVGRAPWGSISREDIVDAAVTIVDAGGYEEMSIRSLAADLGVAPMSLYRHIRDKDDLLNEVVDRLLARVWHPAVAEDDWQAWIVEAAANLRQFLVTQPAALHVYLRHPVVSPAAVDRMDVMMGVLRRGGLDEATARSAYGALHTYTIGFAALEASRGDWVPDGGDVSSLAQQLAAYTTAGQFIGGLRYLLEGIGRHAGSGLGVVAVREYEFRAIAAFDPACDSAAGAYLSRTRPYCVIQPSHRRYFPALISCDNQPPPPGSLNILVRMALTATEADVFFAPGQRFAIWADAIVGETIRGEGLVGYGVITCRDSPPPPSAHDHAAHRPRADLASPSPG